MAARRTGDRGGIDVLHQCQAVGQAQRTVDEEWGGASDYTPHPGHDHTAAVAAVPTVLRDPPDLLDSQATITRERSGGSHGSEHGRQRRRAKKKMAKAPSLPTEQYPFPATSQEDEEPLRSPATARRIPQMRTQKARDGGRTQSGGVRGIPADDIDDV